MERRNFFTNIGAVILGSQAIKAVSATNSRQLSQAAPHGEFGSDETGSQKTDPHMILDALFYSIEENTGAKISQEDRAASHERLTEQIHTLHHWKLQARYDQIRQTGESDHNDPDYANIPAGTPVMGTAVNKSGEKWTDADLIPR